MARTPTRPIPALTEKDIARFWSHVAKAGGNDCWLWLASKCKLGYGYIKLGGFHGQNYITSRVAWTIANGPIPDGLLVLHRCDTASCVRSDHLFLGTDADNCHDRDRKGRAGPHPVCPPEKRLRGDMHPNRIHPENMPRGEDHHNAIMTEAKVLEIRQRYIPRVVTQKILASEYGVDHTEISCIIRRRLWKHVGGPPAPNTDKLTPDMVRSIRLERPTSTLRKLAKKYGVTRGYVANIMAGRAWKSVV